MKLLRVGEVGHEKIAALDKNNVIRDLSDQIDNLSSDTFNDEYIEKIKKIDLSKKKGFKFKDKKFFKKTGLGLIPAPTPSGVPKIIKSPLLSLIKLLKYEMI